MNKIKVLFLSEQLIPSSIISIVKPFIELQNAGEIKFTMRFAKIYKEKDIKDCDVIVLCRIIASYGLKIIDHAKKYGKKIIYDIDDNFFELSSESAIGQFHRYPIHLFVLTEMLKNADAVRVYSLPMKEIAEQYNNNVYFLKSYFDFRMLDGLKKGAHDKIRIVYATSRGKNDDLAKIYLSALSRILNEFEDKVEFYAFGQIPEELKNFQNVYKIKYEANYFNYIKKFYSLSFDIGLAPLVDDRFHNSKTNNKFREYGAMGVCGVYSNTPIYSECVANGINGLLVDNSADGWYSAIKELIKNSQLREVIKKNAEEDVKKYYSLNNTLADWRTIIGALPAKPYSTKYNNVLNADIAILTDTSFKYANLRTRSLYDVLGFCGIKYKVFDMYKVKKKDILNRDIIICFINSNRDIEFLADRLALYGLKNIIFDTMQRFDETAKYPEIIFTNPGETSSENVFPIDYKIDISNVNLNQCLEYSAVSSSDESDNDTISEYFGYINKIKEYYNKFFSIDDARFQWAQLLKRYKVSGSGKQESVCKQKINGLLYSVYYKIQRVSGGISRKFARFKLLANNGIDYLKINIFKKY